MHNPIGSVTLAALLGVGCASAPAPEAPAPSEASSADASRRPCTVWYADRDGDGFGGQKVTRISCERPLGFVANSLDCDDRDDATHPSADETCDGVDQDCDDSIDEDLFCSAGAGPEICDDGLDQNADGIGCEPRGTLGVESAASWAPAMAGSGTGWDVEYAGDVDGDGQSDWLAGGPAFWSGDVGETRLVYGSKPSAGTNPLSAAAAFQGDAPGDSAGYASAPAGDVDSDGFDDFLVTAPGSDIGAEDGGGAFLVYGDASRYAGSTAMRSVGARFLGSSDFEFAGASVMSLGHFDGDTYADFAVGSLASDVAGRADVGAVHIYYGSAAARSGDYALGATADAIVHGTASWSAMADQNAIASADLDADGMDDLLVGAWDTATAPLGADVFLFYGDSDGLAGKVPVTTADARFQGTVGWWSYIEIADAGDVNGDGYDEVLIGLPDQQANQMGSAYLFYGGAARRAGILPDAEADVVFHGSADNDFELTVSAGDIDGDELNDVVIGSRGTRPPRTPPAPCTSGTAGP